VCADIPDVRNAVRAPGRSEKFVGSGEDAGWQQRAMAGFALFKRL